MAATLLGMHRDQVCADCGFAFACDAAVRPVSPRAVCPNCGQTNNSMESLPDLDGDRLLIDRSAFHFRRPRRWEIVAFRHPREADKILIKRVVGLPGDSVQIQNGEVVINGRVQRKSLERQRSMAVPVYDAKYSPAMRPIPPPRWRGENEKSLWCSANGRFSHPNTTSTDGTSPVDWLIYHHWRRTPGRQDEVQECPVTDIMSYNQSLPRREEDVHPLNDLMLALRLAKIFGQGKFFIRAIDGNDVFQVEIDPNAGVYRATRNSSEILQNKNQLPPNIKDLDIIVSLIDRQFLLAINNQNVICQPIDDPVLQTETSSQPFALGTDGLGVMIDDLRIYRDVYYTHPIGPYEELAIEKPIQLGEDEYFVLGDNSSIAEDSRNWPGHPAVDDNLLIGKPLMILFPAKSVKIGAWQFQVPDLSRIGYIR